MSCNSGADEGLTDETKQMEGTVSPFDRLPPEIILGIFICCFPEGPAKNFVPDPLTAPLLLCQISRYWRQLALSTPTLWCSVSVIQSEVRTPSDISLVSCLETWINRSGSCPLSLYIESGHPNSSWDSPDFALPPACMHMILGCSRRWRELNIAALDMVSLLALADLPSDATPLLESFSMPRRMRSGDPYLHQLAFLRSASRLRAIRTSCDFTISLLVLPWSQISSLRLEFGYGAFAGIDDCMHLLRQCPNITEFMLSMLRLSQAPYTGPPIIVLPNLTSLALKFQISAHLASFLNTLVAPHLRSFRVHFNRLLRHDIWPEDAFLFIFQRSARLRELRFYVEHLPEEPFMNYLRSVPALDRLAVGTDQEHVVMTDRTLHLLTSSRTNSESCLLPNLEHLHIFGLKAFSDKALIDMILSRWKPCSDCGGGSIESSTYQPGLKVACLKSIQLNWPRESFDAETNSVFDRLSREGLEIAMWGPNSIVEHEGNFLRE